MYRLITVTDTRYTNDSNMNVQMSSFLYHVKDQHCNSNYEGLKFNLPEIRRTAEFHGGVYPPCHTAPRTYSRLSSLFRCGPTS